MDVPSGRGTRRESAQRKYLRDRAAYSLESVSDQVILSLSNDMVSLLCSVWRSHDSDDAGGHTHRASPESALRCAFAPPARVPPMTKTSPVPRHRSVWHGLCLRCGATAGGAPPPGKGGGPDCPFGGPGVHESRRPVRGPPVAMSSGAVCSAAQGMELAAGLCDSWHRLQRDSAAGLPRIATLRGRSDTQPGNGQHEHGRGGHDFLME